MSHNRTPDAPPTATSRDLVLSDEDLAGMGAALMDDPVHLPTCAVFVAHLADPDCDCGFTATTRRLIAEVRRLRAAVKGHECLLGLKPWPAEFRPPLEPHDGCCPHPLIEHYPNGCGWCICKTAGSATDDPMRRIEAVRAAIEGRSSVNVSVILSALGEQE